MKTLIVEDDAVARLVLEKTLQARSHQVFACSTGEEALQIQARENASLIVTDLGLPGLGGLELCAALRRQWEDVHLLVVTAHDSPSVLEDVLEAGADDYLPKPYNQDTLHVRLRIAERNISQTARRREAEHALMQAREDLRRVIDHLPAAVIIHRDGQILYSNPAWIRLTGHLHTASLLNRDLRTLLPPGDTRSHQALAMHLRGAMEDAEREIRILRPDGEVVTLELAPPRYLMWRHTPASLMVALDITERKAIQSQLFLADRLASVGTMSAGIAHEINNPLSYVMGNLSQLEEELERLAPLLPSEDRQDFREMLQEASDGAKRVAEIVRDMRTYASMDDDVQSPVQLTRVLEMTLNMAAPQLHGIRVLRQEDPEIPMMMAHEARLGQVLFNLIVNAAHALQDTPREDRVLLVKTRGEGQNVVIEIKDNGVGIPSEHLNRIFDPFFTTRPINTGMGLGLFVCHNLVQAFGGKLELDSDHGQGTTVRVTLPITPASPRRRRTPMPMPSNTRVLIVDSDPQIGRGLKRALRSQQVTLAEDHQQASDLLRQQHFEAILCDLLGEHPPGLELYHDSLKRDPEQARRFVFMTGGALTQKTQRFLASVNNPRLEKPFSIADFLFLLQGLQAESASPAM